MDWNWILRRWCSCFSHIPKRCIMTRIAINQFFDYSFRSYMIHFFQHVNPNSWNVLVCAKGSGSFCDPGHSTKELISLNLKTFYPPMTHCYFHEFYHYVTKTGKFYLVEEVTKWWDWFVHWVIKMAWMYCNFLPPSSCIYCIAHTLIDIWPLFDTGVRLWFVASIWWLV